MLTRAPVMTMLPVKVDLESLTAIVTFDSAMTDIATSTQAATHADSPSAGKH